MHDSPTSDNTVDPADPNVPDDTDIPEPGPLVHLVTPLAAIVVTMVVRKAVNSAYEQVTGRSAPLPRDPRVPLWRAVAWTAVIAASAAAAEVVVYRAFNRMGAR